MQYIFKGVADKGVPASSVHLRDIQFQPCIGCERCRRDKICTGLKDGMSTLYPCLLEARGLVMVSPTHNYNVTAWIKAFIDRLYCFYDFDDNRPRGWTSRLAGQDRKALIVAVCEQKSKRDMGVTLEAMRRPLEVLGYEIVGELPVFSVFDKAKIKAFPEVLDQATALGERLAGAL